MILEVILRQLEIERIGIAAGHVMVRLPGPDPDDIARVAVYRHGEGWLVLFGATVPADDRERLARLSEALLLDDAAAVAAVIGRAARTEYRTHTFEAPPDPGSAQGVVVEPGLWTVYVGQRRVAWARSSREGPRAAELAVETLPEFRRRGYARRVASAWAAAKLAEGKTCFYSYLAANHSSEMLARSLSVVWQFYVAAYR